MIKFTQITDKLPYPSICRSILSMHHASVVTYATNNFDNTSKSKRKIVDAINILSYVAISGDDCLRDWDANDPLENLPDIGDDEIHAEIDKYDLFLSVNDITWDIEATFQPSQMHVIPADKLSKSKTDEKPSSKVDPNRSNVSEKLRHSVSGSSSIRNKLTSSDGKDLLSAEDSRPRRKLMLKDETPKEDLYIQHPVVPRFDVNHVYAYGVDGNDTLVIYHTLPEIPTKQSEISLTTDVNLFQNDDLLKLFPKQFIRTRADCMYDKVEGLPFHEKLGVILPIEGYSQDILIDNIIKYPHLYQLMKTVDDNFTTFYSTIEIDRQLHNIRDIWEDLPDTKYIPKTKEYIKEYVVRRYLLERDIDNVEHRYPIYGSLDPYLTLFTTPEDYVKFGYDDVIQLARNCVQSRVSYRSSRNPVLRRLQNV